MERDGRPSNSRRSEEFVESAIIDTCVPAQCSLDIEDLVSSWDGSVDEQNSSLLSFIPERDALFLDEQASVLVVLRTPYLSEDALKSYVARLIITLEAHATSTAPPPKVQGDSSGPSKELLHTDIIDETFDPFVFISNGDDESKGSNGAHVYLIWKTRVFLRHPRARLHRPAIYFTATAVLRPPQGSTQPSQRISDDEYMTSFEASPINLFQSLAGDPLFSKSKPRLSALKVTKISPNNPVARELARPIRNSSRRLYRAAPAFLWRLRYSRWHSSSNDHAVLASLDIEPTSFVDGLIRLTNVRLALADGTVEDFTEPDGTASPIECKVGDQLTKVFRLTASSQRRQTTGQDGELRDLDISIEAEILISDTCRPKIALEWQTGVQFNKDIVPNFGKSAFVLDRPSSQAGLTPVSQPPVQTPMSPLGPDALPSIDQTSQAQKHKLSELTMSISVTGPEVAHVGEPFKWNIFVVNRSEKQRRLALVVIPQRKRAEAKRHEPKASSSSHKLQRQDETADAVVDDNMEYAKYKNARVDPLDLVCLSTDVRIGPLAPSACYNAELTFLPLTTGILGVDALRLVDVQTQESADVRDLPTIIVSDAPTSERS